MSFDDNPKRQTVDGMEEVLDEEEPTSLERYESGEYSFRDPADEGYEPVEPLDEEPIVEADVDPVVATPDQVSTPESIPVSERRSDELLSSVEPIDTAAQVELSDLNDGKPRNEAGELVTLDPDAAVACGNVEIAIAAMDEDDKAGVSEHLEAAAEFASSSTAAGMTAWAEILNRDTITDGDLIAFVKACVEGGYEL